MKPTTTVPVPNPLVPFNKLPPLLPRAAALETLPVMRACVAARAALARLDASSDLLPNKEILVRTMPLMEAQASSEIENIVTTNDELFRRDSEFERVVDDLPPAEKEAFGYRKALFEGMNMLRKRPVCTNMAVDLCRILKSATTVSWTFS